MQTRISHEHVDALAAGATLLGSGGGGDTAIVADMLRHVLIRHGAVSLITAADLPPDALVVPVAATGSITVMLERLPSGHEFVHAVQAVGRHLDQQPAAVLGFEVGGANLLFSVAAAAWTGLPLIDGDGMGRAFPRIDQVLFNVVRDGTSAISAVPAALADPSGNHLLLTGAVTNADAERLLRAALTALGGWAATAIYPMRAEQADRHAIRGSISNALTLGRDFLEVQRTPRSRAGMLATHQANLVFSGTINQILRHARPSTGATLVVAHDQDPFRTLRIEVADEYMLAIDDGDVIAQVPDIIALLDTRTWQPITAEHAATGRHVDVLRFPAPSAWNPLHARHLVAPSAFGLRVLDDNATSDARESRP
ncbi:MULTISPECIES: DUF917 domain-containing protein [unclassified Nonomuraea]|uniref:DUF917 domain-containing protein n=1 Tax=unclassified Nonomuraea TaxID=2593643 RepID=UPI0033F50EBE